MMHGDIWTLLQFCLSQCIWNACICSTFKQADRVCGTWIAGLPSTWAAPAGTRRLIARTAAPAIASSLAVPAVAARAYVLLVA